MNTTAQTYFKTAILLLVVGLAAGILMAASGDHAAAGAHAHLNLIGFVLMSVYGTYFALNGDKARGRLPQIIWIVHTAGAVVMFVALWLMLSGNPQLEPVVALASFAVLIAAVLFGWVVWRPAQASRGLHTAEA